MFSIPFSVRYDFPVVSWTRFPSTLCWASLFNKSLDLLQLAVHFHLCRTTVIQGDVLLLHILTNVFLFLASRRLQNLCNKYFWILVGTLVALLVTSGSTGSIAGRGQESGFWAIFNTKKNLRASGLVKIRIATGPLLVFEPLVLPKSPSRLLELVGMACGCIRYMIQYCTDLYRTAIRSNIMVVCRAHKLVSVRDLLPALARLDSPAIIMFNTYY